MTDALAARLAARTLELIDVPSESRDEARLAAHVLDLLTAAGVAVRDGGDTCVLAGVTERGERPLVLLAGHFDTVPAQGNIPGRIEDGTVHGLGAVDMKGSLAVMIELAIDRAANGTAGDAVDLGFVFFGREELPSAESALEPLLAREHGLRQADLAIVMEPTGTALQAGCLGNINGTWTFSGRSGHSARPVARRQRDLPRRPRDRRRRRHPRRRARLRRPDLSRDGLGHDGRAAGSRRTSSRTRPPRTSTTATRRG